MHPGTGQIAQFANRHGRKKARSHESELQPLRDAFAVLHVSLAPRQGAHVLRVQEQQLKASSAQKTSFTKPAPASPTPKPRTSNSIPTYAPPSKPACPATKPSPSMK